DLGRRLEAGGHGHIKRQQVQDGRERQCRIHQHPRPARPVRRHAHSPRELPAAITRHLGSRSPPSAPSAGRVRRHQSSSRDRSVDTRYGTISTETRARSTTAMAAPLANWFPRKAVKYMEMAGTLVAALSGPAMTKIKSKALR